jgi:hypothetical protein
MPRMNNPKQRLDHIQLIPTPQNLRTNIFQPGRPQYLMHIGITPKPTGLGRNIKRVAPYLVSVSVHIVRFSKRSTQSMFLMAES